MILVSIATIKWVFQSEALEKLTKINNVSKKYELKNKYQMKLIKSSKNKF